MVPVVDAVGAEEREGPAEIGGELILKDIAECPPKQTLSLALGVVSPTTDSPEVTSLGRWNMGPKSGPEAPTGVPDGTLDEFEAVNPSGELWAANSSPELAMVNPSRLDEIEGEG